MIEACTKTSYLEQTMTLPWHSWVNRKTQSWLFNLPFSRKGTKNKTPPPPIMFVFYIFIKIRYFSC